MKLECADERPAQRCCSRVGRVATRPVMNAATVGTDAVTGALGGAPSEP
jgi:hypothetical protein